MNGWGPQRQLSKPTPCGKGGASTEPGGGQPYNSTRSPPRPRKDLVNSEDPLPRITSIPADPRHSLPILDKSGIPSRKSLSLTLSWPSHRLRAAQGQSPADWASHPTDLSWIHLCSLLRLTTKCPGKGHEFSPWHVMQVLIGEEDSHSSVFSGTLTLICLHRSKLEAYP